MWTAVLGGPATAQNASGPTPPTLADAIEAAWQRSPQNPAAQGRVKRAEADLDASASPWAAPPTAELGTRQGRTQPGAGQVRENEAGVAWPLWLPGQKTARLEAAQAELRASRQAAQLARSKVAAEVREAALTVAGQQAEARQAQLQLRLLTALSQDVERRVAAGDLARADAMAARAEQLSAAASLSEARQREQAARARWQVLTAMQAVPAMDVFVAAATLPAADHPELALAEAQLERARKRLTAAERSRRDPPELGVRVRRESGSAGTGHENSVGVSLRVPLATADRNLPLLAAALSELDVAQAEESRLRERLAVEVDTARGLLALTTEQLESERSRAGLLRERAELIEKSFKAGETPLPETLRALDLAAQADSAVLRQQAAVGLAQARLQQLLGH